MKKKEEIARLRTGKEVMRIFKVLEVKKSSVNLKSWGKSPCDWSIQKGAKAGEIDGLHQVENRALSHGHIRQFGDIQLTQNIIPATMEVEGWQKTE